MKKIKLGFAGTPNVAFAHFSHLLNNPNIEFSFILTQPDKKSGRGLEESKSLFYKYAEEIAVFQPASLSDQGTKDQLMNFDIDLLVVVAYGKLLPKWLLSFPKFGSLNVHFSLLPKWRGAAPIQRAIENGDKITGISFMKIIDELDAGPVYSNFVVDIENNDFFQVEKKLLGVSLDNINSIIHLITSGSIEPKEQINKKATYAEKIDPKKDALIDWSWSSKLIKNKYLAYKKWPILSFQINGEKVQIHELDVLSGKSGSPGEIHSFSKESLSVFCKDGSIEIKSVKFPGKKVISSIDFFNAKRDIISSGDILV